MLQDYINRAPLTRDVFKSDASVAHTYIVKFISGNPTAEAKFLPHTAERNGRLDFKSLIEHYEGVGILMSRTLRKLIKLSIPYSTMERGNHTCGGKNLRNDYQRHL